MKNLIEYTTKDRSAAYLAAAGKISLPAHVIEKDFWVCWILDLLFSLDQTKGHLTFKGGTSLSKVYNKIRRFSEDIDISIDKQFLGFSGERNPSEAASKKKATKLIKELGQKCSEYVKSELKSILEEEITKKLSDAKEKISWKLEIDPSDPGEQTLLFHYPTSGKTDTYVRKVVKIELGARAEHWPVEMKKIVSYVEAAVFKPSEIRDIEIQVLTIERTFWEKATILHMFANFPSGKEIPIRQSRHYYDFYCLVNSDTKVTSLEKIDLLTKVAEHKELYFRSGWANYEEAKTPSTLKIIPNEIIESGMREDYGKMKEMFFETPPAWEKIIHELKSFEETLRKI